MCVSLSNLFKYVNVTLPVEQALQCVQYDQCISSKVGAILVIVHDGPHCVHCDRPRWAALRSSLTRWANTRFAPTHCGSLIVRSRFPPVLAALFASAIGMLQCPYGRTNNTPAIARLMYRPPTSTVSRHLLLANARGNRVLALRLDHRASDRAPALAVERLCALW